MARPKTTPEESREIMAYALERLDCQDCGAAPTWPCSGADRSQYLQEQVRRRGHRAQAGTAGRRPGSGTGRDPGQPAPGAKGRDRGLPDADGRLLLHEGPGSSSTACLTRPSRDDGRQSSGRTLPMTADRIDATSARLAPRSLRPGLRDIHP